MRTVSTIAAFIIVFINTLSAQRGTNPSSIMIAKRQVSTIQTPRKAIDAEKYIVVGPRVKIANSPDMLLVQVDSVKEIFSKLVVAGKIDQTITPATTNTLSDIKITYCEALTDFGNNYWLFGRGVFHRPASNYIRFRFRVKSNSSYLVSLDLDPEIVPPPDKFTLNVYSSGGDFPFDQDFIIKKTTKNVSFILESGDNPSEYNVKNSDCYIHIKAVLAGGLVENIKDITAYNIKLSSIRVKEL